MRIKITSMLLALSLFPFFCAQAQDTEGYAADREAAMTAALRQLSERDALVRQRAAEELAKFSAVEHQRLVEGYSMQEKHERVRLALDWALYRMGKTDALYGVVRSLRSDERRLQAVGYLSGLASPRPLYIFFDRADGKTVIGLLQVMATIGDEDTLDLIRPFESSVEPGVSDTATFSIREITKRLAQTPQDTQSRPRVSDNPKQP